MTGTEEISSECDFFFLHIPLKYLISAPVVKSVLPKPRFPRPTLPRTLPTAPQTGVTCRAATSVKPPDFMPSGTETYPMSWWHPCTEWASYNFWSGHLAWLVIRGLEARPDLHALGDCCGCGLFATNPHRTEQISKAAPESIQQFPSQCPSSVPQSPVK